MACTRPIPGWRGNRLSKTGKRPTVFRPQEGIWNRPMLIPCGSCDSCIEERQRQWVLRCYHELRMSQTAYFITLTYNDLHCPWELEKKHLQDWFKRARKSLGEFRYFAVGEYGEQNARPHFHVLAFGLALSDLLQIGGSPERPLYTSARLGSTWPFGYHSVGTCSLETISYVVNYMSKPARIDGRRPQFQVMSRRPGLGTSWYERFGTNAMAKDFTVVDGRKVRAPKFYLSKLDKTDAALAKKIREARSRWGRRKSHETYSSRRYSLAETASIRAAKKAKARPMETGRPNLK